MINSILSLLIFGAVGKGVLAQTDQLCFSGNDSQNLSTMIDLATKIAEIRCNRTQNITSCPTCAPPPRPVDCADLRARNVTESGNYMIYPNNIILNGSAIEVNCDMQDEDGGWTVIQRRGNYSNPPDFFYKTWAEYKTGFGNITEDFWLGNDNIYAMTNQKHYKLKFTLSDWENNTVYATYRNFYIESEGREYRYYVGSYVGDAGDSFSSRSSGIFSARDRGTFIRCARYYNSGWWFQYRGGLCTDVNINGNYWIADENGRRYGGITWKTFKGDFYSLKYTEMKIKPM